MNQEAAKVMGAAAQVDMQIAPERAIQWITRNAAKSLGILEQTGTLEPGKMADVVIWNGNPFSVYTKVDQVYIDVALAYDRSDPTANPVSDSRVFLDIRSSFFSAPSRLPDDTRSLLPSHTTAVDRGILLSGAMLSEDPVVRRVPKRTLRNLGSGL